MRLVVVVVLVKVVLLLLLIVFSTLHFPACTPSQAPSKDEHKHSEGRPSRQREEKEDLLDMSGYSHNTKQEAEKEQKQRTKIKYHIFFNFGKQPERMNTNNMRGDPQGTGNKGTIYLRFQPTHIARSKTWTQNRGKAKYKVSYFLQLWKAYKKDEHERHERINHQARANKKTTYLTFQATHPLRSKT